MFFTVAILAQDSSVPFRWPGVSGKSMFGIGQSLPSGHPCPPRHEGHSGRHQEPSLGSLHPDVARHDPPSGGKRDTIMLPPGQPLTPGIQRVIDRWFVLLFLEQEGGIHNILGTLNECLVSVSRGTASELERMKFNRAIWFIQNFYMTGGLDGLRACLSSLHEVLQRLEVELPTVSDQFGTPMRHRDSLLPDSVKSVPDASLRVPDASLRVPDALTVPDAVPVPDALPVPDAVPMPDALPVAASLPVQDALPVADALPVPEALPVPDALLEAVSLPVQDALPVADALSGPAVLMAASDSVASDSVASYSSASDSAASDPATFWCTMEAPPMLNRTHLSRDARHSAASDFGASDFGASDPGASVSVASDPTASSPMSEARNLPTTLTGAQIEKILKCLDDPKPKKTFIEPKEAQEVANLVRDLYRHVRADSGLSDAISRSTIRVGDFEILALLRNLPADATMPFWLVEYGLKVHEWLYSDGLFGKQPDFYGDITVGDVAKVIDIMMLEKTRTISLSKAKEIDNIWKRFFSHSEPVSIQNGILTGGQVHQILKVLDTRGYSKKGISPEEAREVVQCVQCLNYKETGGYPLLPVRLSKRTRINVCELAPLEKLRFLPSDQSCSWDDIKKGLDAYRKFMDIREYPEPYPDHVIGVNLYYTCTFQDIQTVRNFHTWREVWSLSLKQARKVNAAWINIFSSVYYASVSERRNWYASARGSASVYSASDGRTRYASGSNTSDECSSDMGSSDESISRYMGSCQMSSCGEISSGESSSASSS